MRILALRRLLLAVNSVCQVVYSALMILHHAFGKFDKNEIDSSLQNGVLTSVVMIFSKQNLLRSVDEAAVQHLSK